MLKVPASADYGLLAAIHLAEKHGSGDLSRAAEIAERRDIPRAYLERLLSQLRTAGLVESFRGPGGGHRLARPPDRVTAREVLQALTGAWPSPEGGRLDWLWRRYLSAVHEALDVTLVELAAQVRAADDVHGYQI